MTTVPDHVQKNIDAFFASIQSFAEAYRNDTFAYLALKTADGFTVVQASLYLNDARRNFPHEPFESANLRAGHLRLADLDLSREELVRQLCSGKLSTPQGELLFPPGSGQSYSTYLQLFHPEGLKTQTSLSVLSLMGAESRQFVDPQSLDWELRAAQVPFDGIADLLNEYQIGLLRHGANRVELIAFNVGAVDATSRIDGETAKLVVRVGSGLTPDKLSVGYRVLDRDRVVERKSLAGNTFEWKADADFLLGTTEFSVPRGAIVQCFVRAGGVAQHYYWFGDPTTFQNMRRASFEAVDPGLANLKKIYDRVKTTQRGVNARELECVAAWLFWMLGFSAVHLGEMPQTQDASDLIVCTPNGHFAVVECTTGLLKADNKLPLLHARTQAIRRKLDESNGRHIRLLPVLLTTRTKDDVLPDLDQAAKFGIHVITHEAFDEMVLRTFRAPDADQLYEQAEQTVKAAQQQHDLDTTLAAEPGIPGIVEN